jgi:predicted NBD/HSP70 family sugar kinase
LGDVSTFDAIASKLDLTSGASLCLTWIARKDAVPQLSKGRIIEYVVREPRTEGELVTHVGSTISSPRPRERIHRSLHSLQEQHLVVRPDHPSEKYFPGPACGVILATAAGSATLNAGAFTAGLQGIRRTMNWTRFEKARHTDGQLLKKLGYQLADAWTKLSPTERAHLQAVSVAASLGFDDAGNVVPDASGRGHGEAGQERIEHAMVQRLEELGFTNVRLPASQHWLFTTDAAAEAMSEHRWGGHRIHGPGPLLLVKATRQVRSALLLNGEPYQGAHGNTFALGHVEVDAKLLADAPWSADEIDKPENEQWCKDCHHKPCLQEVIHPERLLAAIREISREEARKEFADLGTNETDPAFFQRLYGNALDAGDPLATKVFRQTGRLLGRVLQGVVAQTDPAVVVITGLTPRAGKVMLVEIEKECPRTDASFVLATNLTFDRDCGGQLPHGVEYVRPRETPNQWRVTAGGALLAAKRVLWPWLEGAQHVDLSAQR